MKATGKLKKSFLWGVLLSLLLLGRVTQVVAQGCVVPPDGLLGWWPGDGGSNDIVGPNPGALFGGTSFEAGLVDQAFSFDGASGFMTIGQPLSLTAGTAEFWINRGELTGSSDAFFGSANGGANRTPTFIVRTGQTLLWEFGNLVVQDTNIPIAVGEWYHLAMTWQRNPDASHSVAVYLDGEEVDYGVSIGATNFADPFVGAYNQQGPADQFANALLDELQIYNRALSYTEIQAIFNAGSAGKCKPCRSSVTSLAELNAEVDGLMTSVATANTLAVILDKAQSSLDNSKHKKARQQLRNFISKVVKRSNLKDKENNRILLDEANSLICGAANVFNGIPLP